MADEEQTTAGDESWKQRYFDTVGQLEVLERAEREWREAELLLRQCISRLAILVEGGDRALDEQLRALRDAVRDGADGAALSAQVDMLSDAIRRLDRAEQQAVQPPAKGLFGRFFGGETPPEEPVPEVDQAKSLQLARRLLRRVVAAFAGRAGEPGRALLDQLDAAGQEEELSRLADQLADLIGTSGPGPDGSGSPIHEILLRLLERLDVPDELVPRVEELKTRLSGGLPREQVDATLADIAALVTQMRSRVQSEKKGLEEFLKQLSERLKELDENLQLNLKSERQSYEGGRRLDAAVRGQVADIEHSVRDAADLRTMQHAVRRHLDTIRKHMTAFRQTEDRRIRESEQRVRALTERLNSVEGEAKRLRENLHRERKQALVDPLTGTPNRLAYNERIAQEFARWKRYGHPLCLAVWDVDRFKSINDAYGHQAGDRVLRVVAKVLSGETRSTDFVARYGGEEFVMLLPETDIEAAMAVADKLRQAVGTCEFHHRGKPVSVTISCGVAEFRAADDPDTVFQRADSALYRAKDAGRNRCCREDMSADD